MALLFVAASSQYLSQTSPIITFTPCSWALWFKPASLSSNMVLIGVGNSSAINYRDILALTTGAAEAIQNQLSVGAVTAISAATPITVGTWCHIAAVYTSTTSVTVYLNGVATTGTGTAVTPSGVNQTTLGALQRGGTITSFTDGAIAYPAAWAATGGYALTQTDVNALYAGGIGSDPRLVQTAKLTSFSLLQTAAPFPDQYRLTNWTINGSPTVVADPFTLGNPPTVTEQVATSITATSATLNGNITNLNSGGNATVYGFNYGFTSAYGNTVTSSTGSYGTGAFTLNVASLAPGVMYHFQSFAIGTGGTGFSTDGTFTTSPGVLVNKGAVLYNGPTTLSSGSTASGSVANLFDGNNQTTWISSTNNSWAGIDCGAFVTLSQLVYSSNPGAEDAVIGCTLNGSLADPTFASPTLLASFPSTGGANGLGRAHTATLQNSIIVSPSSSYRYYMVQAANGTGFQFGDLDFQGSWASGAFSRPVAPTMTPMGGNFDQPTVVRISSLTTSATIYYTTDGSTPTASSTQYAGPFVVSASAVVEAIAVDVQLTTPSSRVRTCRFIIPSKLYAHQQTYDNRGHGLKGAPDCIFLDPVSNYYYLYVFSQDQPGVYTTGQPLPSTESYSGHNSYRSADLRNWTYVGQIAGAAPGVQVGGYQLIGARLQMFYCATTQLYVAWSSQEGRSTSPNSAGLDVWSSPFPDGRQQWTHVTTYNSGNAIADGNSGPFGDVGGFIDPISGNSFLMYNYNGNNNTAFSQLNPANMINTLGTNKATYTNGMGGGIGAIGEGHAMFYFGGTYFYFSSLLTGVGYNLNTYRSGSTPIGPWTNGSAQSGVNPFTQISSGPTLPGLSTLDSGLPNYLLAYQSQAEYFVSLPGRNCIIMGNVDLAPGTGGSNQSTIFGLDTIVHLPVTITSSTAFTITWLSGTWFDGSADSDWALDSVFPTVSGAPLSATNFTVSNNIATWTNNEPKPVCLYFDNSSDPTFATGVVSEVLAIGSTSFNITPSLQPNASFRIRVVNVNGTTSTTFAASGPSITNLSVSGIVLTSAVVQAAIISDGGSSSTVTGFHYGLTSGYGSTVSTTQVIDTGNFSNLISGLTAGTMYFYQAFATNATATSVSAGNTFTTLSIPPTPPPPGPPAPGGLVVNDLEWNADLARCAIGIEIVADEDDKQDKLLRNVYNNIITQITTRVRL